MANTANPYDHRFVDDYDNVKVEINLTFYPHPKSWHSTSKTKKPAISPEKSPK